MFDRVLFDLDGTLTDPADGIIASFRHALGRVGHPVAEDADLRWMIGPPIRDNLTAVGLPDHLHDDAVSAYRDRHTDIGLYDVSLHPGIEALLADLRAAGSSIAVATFKPTLQAELTIQHLGLTHAVDAVVGVDADLATATKVPVLTEALARLGGAGSAVMVGDRHHDIDAGRACGCTTVGVAWGYAGDGELEAAGADHLVATVAGLSTVLLGAGATAVSGSG